MDVSGKVVELALEAESTARERRRTHWEFRTLKENLSIIVDEGAVVFQTTANSNFEEFLEVLSHGMLAIDAVVGELIVERIGLRYVNAIQPGLDESCKAYVKPGYHGQENDIIRADNSVFFIQTISDTGPGKRMIVRLAQNRDGALLSRDLVPHHPVPSTAVEQEKLVSLIDLDHYREERQPFEIRDRQGCSCSLAVARGARSDVSGSCDRARAKCLEMITMPTSISIRQANSAPYSSPDLSSVVSGCSEPQ